MASSLSSIPSPIPDLVSQSREIDNLIESIRILLPGWPEPLLIVFAVAVLATTRGMQTKGEEGI